MTPQLSPLGARRRSRSQLRTAERSQSQFPAPRQIPPEPVEWASLPEYQIVVKSFRRFRCLENLLKSIFRFYPDASVIIADDSFEEPDQDAPDIVRQIQKHPNVQWIQLPFNCGLSVGRNTAVRAASADVIIMCDDDFVFTHESRIENFLSVLRDRPDIDLIGGAIRFHAQDVSHWCGHLKAVPGTKMKVTPLTTPWETTGHVRHRRTDLNDNWYAAKRDTLINSGWDDRFKIVFEHIDHFMTMQKNGVNIHYTPDSIIGHESRRPDDYGEFRIQNIAKYQEILHDKWKVSGRPDWPQQPEPATPKWEPAIRQSAVVLGVGHSGTTILTKMLSEIGFNAHNADSEYCENTYVREINDKLIFTGKFDTRQACMELAYMEQWGGPWIVKDPRFVHTLPNWLPAFRRYEPTLFLIERDAKEVESSYRKRGECRPDGSVLTRGLTLEQAQQQARSHYDAWPWAKMTIPYSGLAAAVGLFHSR